MWFKRSKTWGAMNNVNCTSCHKSGAMRSAYCTLRLPPEVMVGTVLVPPSYSLRRARLSKPRDRMSSERRRGMGQIGKGRAPLDPIRRENRDVRSGLWPKPWMAKAKGPSARAVGQAGEPKEPDEVGRINGGGLSFGDFSLATQRKVTRPSPKGGRNPFEASGLASCTAKPCHRLSPRTITLTG